MRRGAENIPHAVPASIRREPSPWRALALAAAEAASAPDEEHASRALLRRAVEATGAERAFLVLTLKYSIMVVAILPMLVIFPFVQRYFVKGVMIGALKG